MNPLDRLPRPGELVTVHAVGFGDVRTTGEVAAGPDGGPITDTSPQGVPLARVITEDGFAEWVPWVLDPARVLYYLHGEEGQEAPAPVVVAPDPADAHPLQEPRTHWRRAARPWRDRAPAPLTEEELAQEERARLAGLAEVTRPKKPRPAGRAAVARAVPVAQDTWDQRAGRTIAEQEHRIRAKAREVQEAKVALRRAERAYYQEGQPRDEEGQQGLFDGEAGVSPHTLREQHLQALLAAQERHRQAVDGLREVEHAAPLVIARELAASWRLPSWLAAVGVAGLLVVGGPLLMIGLGLVVGLPLLAFLSGWRR